MGLRRRPSSSCAEAEAEAGGRMTEAFARCGQRRSRRLAMIMPKEERVGSERDKRWPWRNQGFRRDIRRSGPTLQAGMLPLILSCTARRQQKSSPEVSNSPIVRSFACHDDPPSPPSHCCQSQLTCRVYHQHHQHHLNLHLHLHFLHRRRACASPSPDCALHPRYRTTPQPAPSSCTTIRPHHGVGIRWLVLVERLCGWCVPTHPVCNAADFG